MLIYAVLKLGESLGIKIGECNLFRILKQEMKDADVNVYQLTIDIDVYYDEGYFLKRFSQPTMIIKNSPEPYIHKDDVLLLGPLVFANSNSDSNGTITHENMNHLYERITKSTVNNKEVYIYKNY